MSRDGRGRTPAAHHAAAAQRPHLRDRFFAFAIVIAVVFAEFLIGFIANSH
ncbi:MAG TPA: hypothetical protein VGJ45_30605 [Pseudonocardiaceae bacterium]|jgi:Co/Zn/Cd efflux system component